MAALPLEVGGWVGAKYADPPEIGADTRELLTALVADAAAIAALVETGVVHVGDGEG